MLQLTNLVKRAIKYIATHKTNSILGSILILAGFMYTLAFFIPQTLQFSYSGANCVTRPILLPDLHKTTDTSKFTTTYENKLKIGSLNIAASKLCVSPTSAPKSGVVIAAVAPFGGLIARSHIAIKLPQAPSANVTAMKKPIPVSRQLNIPLSESDGIFKYSLAIADKTADCKPANRSLNCDVPSLKLEQDKQYDDAVLSRQFKESKPVTLSRQSIRTLKAVSITGGSLRPGQTVYDKPATFTFTADKQLKKANAALKQLTPQPKDIPVTATVEGSSINLSFTDQLARESSYELVLTNVEATDGSTLVDSYKAPFIVSGGPKVAKTNIGTSKTDVSATVFLDFDQPLSDKQPVQSFVRFSGGNATVSKVSPTRISVTLANLPRCAPFSIEVLPGLLSSYDIATKAVWKYSSRTICYSLSTIGTSVKGRPISAYTFGGNGPTTLFVGALHGNEVSSSLILKDWVNELEANYSRIPTNARVVVVPTANPDGVAANTRNNSRNVNLNRNFPTSDWQSDIKDTNGNVKGGGGPSPLSEPEAKALASLSSSLRPRLLISYHAVGSLVVGDPGGYSAGYAAKYASMVGYRNATGQSSSTFDYSITGSYEDWTIQKVGIPSMVVELGSYTYRDFSHHKEAFWSMLR